MDNIKLIPNLVGIYKLLDSCKTRRAAQSQLGRLIEKLREEEKNDSRN